MTSSIVSISLLFSNLNVTILLLQKMNILGFFLLVIHVPKCP